MIALSFIGHLQGNSVGGFSRRIRLLEECHKTLLCATGSYLPLPRVRLDLTKLRIVK
jgi:hypothetical protein